MLRNYLKTAFRNLLNQKGSAVLNIAGLSLGITASIILFLLVNHMLSFDKFQANYDRIYRVVTQSDGNNGKNHTPGVPSVLAPAFKNDFPEAEAVMFASYRSGSLILVPRDNAEPKKFDEEAGVVFIEPTFFSIFSRNVLIGDGPKSLDEPNEAVISKSLAKKYFEREDVVGETVMLGTREYRIGAVIDDPTDNTDFPFTLLLSYETIRKDTEENGWGSIWSDEHVYFLLKEGESIEKLEARMPQFTKKYVENNWNNQEFLIQPLSTIHYDGRFGSYTYNTVSEQNISALFMVAVFLVLTACINFVNLATAEAVKRSKEVGIRKTLGSTRSQLVFQFLGETAIVTLIAVVLSLGLAQLGLGLLNPFLEMNLKLNLLGDWRLPAFLTALFVFVSLFSGLYPSFVLSGYKPALAIKNKMSSFSTAGFNLRRGLVVVQFFISQSLIIGTIVIITQTNYFKSKDLGFAKDAIVTMPIPESGTPEQTSKLRALAHEISQLPGVEQYTLCSTPPSSGSVSGTGFILEGEEDSKRKNTQVKLVDDKYISLFDLKMLAGTGLPDLDTATGFVVNRKFAEVSGFTNPQEMVGKRVRIWGRMLPVLGVVENFHATSLHNNIEPLVMFNRADSYGTLAIRIQGQTYQATLDEAKRLWDANYPKHLFSYRFMDDEIREFYEGDERMSTLLTVFTSLAICIGCLGLFGLATFMANQKTKEIGIRKVMGASVESIVFMFSREYARLIVIGFVIAAPAAWWVMNMWLEDFAYKIDLGAWIFATGFGVTLLIAVITVGYRSLRAATANPVKSLRYE